jgi:hypothetical protein
MTQARPQPANDPLVTPAGPSSPEQQPGSSKSRQKKFHRHFKQVAAEEHVLNCEYRYTLRELGRISVPFQACISAVLVLEILGDRKRTVFTRDSQQIRHKWIIKRKTCDIRILGEGETCISLQISFIQSGTRYY